MLRGQHSETAADTVVTRLETDTPGVCVSVQSHFRAHPRHLHRANDHRYANIRLTLIVPDAFNVKLPDLTLSCRIVDER